MTKTKFYKILFSEFYKVRRNIGFISILLFPIVVSAYLCYAMYNKCSTGNMDSTSFWFEYTRWHFIFYELFYPIIVSFCVASYILTEFKNKGIYHQFTLPVTKHQLFLAKVIMLNVYVLASLFMSYSLLVLSGNILSKLFPNLVLSSFCVRGAINLLFIRTFTVLSAIVLVQLFLSLLSHNFFVPISINIGFIIVCTVMPKSRFALSLPHGCIRYAFTLFYQEDNTLLSNRIVVCIIYITIFYLLSYFLFAKYIKITKKND